MTTPPNIVLILVDDADAKVLNHAASSRIRAALLDEGATATRYLNTHPLCAPSRATMLRGMYPQNTGVVGNNGAYKAFQDNDGETSNVARWLKAAPVPYRTALIGKYMNKYEPTTHGKPDAGFDYWFGLGKDAYDSYDYDAWDDYKSGANKIRPYGNDPETDYLTDVLKRKALQFLGNQSSADPFFLMVTPMAPHAPAVPHTDYAGMYSTESYPKIANLSFNEAVVTDKPWYVAMLPQVDQDQQDDIDLWFRRRLECMESVADLVVAVVAKLRDKGLLNNTYVFFTSDHGFHMGEHRLGHDSLQDEALGEVPGGKNSMYEEDIRVPLWIRHPGISVSTVDQLVGNVDLAPTFCDIAGVDLDELSDVIDGRSFLPLLTDQEVSWRTQFLISRGQSKEFVGFRHADEWVFEQLLSAAPNEIAGEYYVGLDDAVSGDPFELNNGYLNLAATEPGRLADMQDLANDYSTCAGDSCRAADSRSI